MRLLFALLLCAVSPLSRVHADLRAASQPRNGFEVRQRNPNVPFQTAAVIYMEPSDFQYQGLTQQRNGGGYDNFLRSNIDNEQDKRNFNNENGRDMLPFRSFEGAATDASATVQTKIPDNAPGPVITATPGQQVLFPLRWNNPHASELEVNVWIMNLPGGGAANPTVVPIRRPTCSGEGHQDNVISFTIPTNFNQLGQVLPGFTGCKKEGDCVLQVYAHSVEPRTYTIGTPLVVTGDVPTATATTPQIEPVKQDVGLDLGKLPRDICLPSTDPSADIPTAVPRAARLVSDVFNHAYQNSDYSPYSGQQPEAISRNLQASAIISMIPANQGELGKALLQQKQPNVANFAAQLRNKVDALVQKYEGLTNKIIAQIGDKVMKNTATEGTNGVQKLATCFRCAEVGAVTPNRLTTSTYIPSFQLPAEQVQAAKAIAGQKYAGLISASGIVQIYQATLTDLSAEFTRAATMGLLYQPAVTKASMATMADATQFKKRNAAGQTDNGVAAASRAQATKQAAARAVDQTMAKATNNIQITPLMATLSADGTLELPESGAPSTEFMADMDGYNTDAACDNDAAPDGTPCTGIKPLFTKAADDSGLAIAGEGSNTSSSTINPAIIGAIVGGVALLAIIATVIVVKHRRNKQTTVVSQVHANTSRV